ncbi:MAG: ABC transporter permease [Bacteroidota bacterium]
MNPTPPQWPLRILRLFLKDEYLEEIEGDMEELYQDNLEHFSASKARNLYAWESLKLLRPILLRNVTSHHPIMTFSMFKHNLIITLRNFMRYRTSFIINLIGLSTGITCFLLIYLWVQDEKQVDKFHHHKEDLFILLEHVDTGEGIQTTSNTSGATGPGLVADFPEVLASATARTKSINSNTLSSGKQDLKASGLFATKDFFQLFSFDLLAGEVKGVLSEPNSIVLSESLALKFFGTIQGVVGKPIELQHEWPLLVSGVFQDPPAQSSLQFDYVVSFEAWAIENTWVMEWGNRHPQTFLLLQPETDIERFNEKISAYMAVKTEGEEDDRTLYATAYGDFYLNGAYEEGKQAGGRIEYVWLFSLIAIFILFIACINFMNLSTAKATRRVKEVGIKKSIGARRSSLIFQYLSESSLLAFLGLGIALLLIWIFLPEFNSITGKQLVWAWDSNLVGVLAGTVVMTGLLAGSYPALYLSGLNPIATIKGTLKQGLGEIWVRKGLVVTQFVLSIILIVSVGVVYKQIAYVQNKNLGYDRENILLFRKEGNLWNESTYRLFVEQIEQIPGVIHASSVGNSMTESDYGTNSISWPGKDPEDRAGFEVMQVEYGMLELLGLEIIEGRAFSPAYGADSTKLLFNEQAIKKMGIVDPIGKQVQWGEDYEIIGVVKDFHLESLHNEISPMVFYLGGHTYMAMIKIKGGNSVRTLQKIQEVYAEINPGFPLEYSFLDDNYEALYASEHRVSTLSRYFAGLAILISCLGLLGLAMFTAAKRQKEIGIRKVLGASTYQLVRLLTDEFSKMVGVAILVALPISYFLTKGWLDSFAFKITLQWWYFLGAGMLAMVIAWFTVGLQTIQAAQVDLVECLKDE